MYLPDYRTAGTGITGFEIAEAELPDDGTVPAAGRCRKPSVPDLAESEKHDAPAVILSWFFRSADICSGLPDDPDSFSDSAGIPSGISFCDGE